MIAMDTVQIVILSITGAVIAGLGAAPPLSRIMSARMKIDDRIRLSGGYESDPPWLGMRSHIDGRVIAFIDSEAHRAAIVRLDEPIAFESITSQIVVLYLRYKDAKWKQHEIVHLELWRYAPQAEQIDRATDHDRQWIESHATYQVLPANNRH